MEREQERRIVEAMILASPEPIAPARIAALLPRCNPSQVRALVDELNAEYAEQRRAFEIWEVAGGYQFRSLPEFAPYLRQIQSERALRLSPAALETLAVVAYRQPVTRAEIEHIRGVDAGAVLRSLLDRHLVRIAGHRDAPGRPMVYGTTRRFLEVFGLAKLGDLPTLRAIEALGEPGEGEEQEDPTAGLGLASPETPERIEARDDDEDDGGAEDPDEERDTSAPSVTH